MLQAKADLSTAGADHFWKLAKRTDDPIVKNELLELASFCEEVIGDKSAPGGVHRCKVDDQRPLGRCWGIKTRGRKKCSANRGGL